MLPESEELERAALEDLHRAATPEQVEGLGLQLLDIGSATVSIAARLPASAIVINRAMGLGLEEPATVESVQQIVSAYREAGVERYYIQMHPEARPEELPEWLRAQGLAPARAWQKFSRGTEPVTSADTDLLIREITPLYGEAFGQTVCTAFDLGESAAAWFAQLPGRDGWHTFMSFYHHEAAGAAALFVQDDLAWLYFDATLPRFRRRGSQGALLASRIRLAQKLGCRRLYTCAGVSVPDQPGHSPGNILKAGFREDYIRENYAPTDS